MKVVIALALLVICAEASPLLIRPSARPQTKPAVPRPCVVIDESELVEEQDLSGLTRPAPVNIGSLTKPGNLLTPGDLIKPGKPTIGNLVKPALPEDGAQVMLPGGISIGSQIIETDGGAQVLLPTIGKPKPVVDEEEYIMPGGISIGSQIIETDDGSLVLLPVDRPLKPSDLINPGSKPIVVEEEFQLPSEFIKPARPSIGDLSKPGVVSIGSLTKPGTVSIGSLTKPGTVSIGSLTKPGTVSIGSLTKPGTVSIGSLTKPGVVSPGSLVKPGVVSPGSLSRPNIVEPEFEGLVKPNKPAFVVEEEEPIMSIYPVPINQQIGGFRPDIFRPVRPGQGIIF